MRMCMPKMKTVRQGAFGGSTVEMHSPSLVSIGVGARHTCRNERNGSTGLQSQTVIQEIIRASDAD